MTIAAVFGAITQAGLVPRGALRLEERERLGDLANIRTIALAGFAGRDGWDAFAKSPEAADDAAHPLDRWSPRVIEALARELGAKERPAADDEPRVRSDPRRQKGMGASPPKVDRPTGRVRQSARQLPLAAAAGRRLNGLGPRGARF
jgi:hypothetical protein